MILRTVVRDCLYLNWALPVAAMPPAPEPLRYDLHAGEGGDFVFASALLFRHEQLRLAAMPALRLSYPQFNLRLNVLDPEGMPSVLFRCILVPPWVVPLVRLVGRQRAKAGQLSFPRAVEAGGDDCWRWQVRRSSALTVEARCGSPVIGTGPRVGSWEETVTYFRRRPRGYAFAAGGLRRVDATQPPAPVWPLQVELSEASLLEDLIEVRGGWPALHSSWLCPEMPFVFDVVREREPAIARHVPAPG
jgi:hypothetical protein